jgi:hypothetical protein
VRILKSKPFAKFARKNDLSDVDLVETVRRVSEGLIDASLGGGLLKLRIARSGQGKSGGFRTILVYRSGDRAIYVYGFAKNVQANISDEDLADLRLLAKRVLAYTPAELSRAVADGTFLEVKDEDKNPIP